MGLANWLTVLRILLIPVFVSLLVYKQRGPALAVCYERGRVLSRRDGGEHVVVEVELPDDAVGALMGYQV